MTSEKPEQFQSSSSAGGEETDTNTNLISRLVGTLQGVATNTITVSGNVVERYLPEAQKRERWMNRIVDFARQRPYLAGFLASQIALSGLPLLFFICTTVSVFVFSILAGILVGIIGGLLFVVPVIGFGLLVLIPVLFFTTAAAVCIWFWGVVGYMIVDWLNQKETSGQQQNGQDFKMKNNSSNGVSIQTKGQETTNQSTLSNSAGTPKEGNDSRVNHQNSSSDGRIQSRRHTPSNSSSTSNSNGSGGGSGGDGNIYAPQQPQQSTQNQISH